MTKEEKVKFALELGGILLAIAIVKHEYSVLDDIYQKVEIFELAIDLLGPQQDLLDKIEAEFKKLLET